MAIAPTFYPWQVGERPSMKTFMGKDIGPRINLFRNILEALSREPVDVYMEEYGYMVRISFRHTGWNQMLDAHMIFDDCVPVEEIARSIVGNMQQKEMHRQQTAIKKAYEQAYSPDEFSLLTRNIMMPNTKVAPVKNTSLRAELQQEVNKWLGS